MSDAKAWALIVGCAVVTFAIKAAGPIALGGRELPDWFARVVTLLAPALLSALVVTQIFADGQELGVGADTAGVAAAGVALWRGVPIAAAVVLAAAMTALLRAVA
ncbi:MAG TPA: AzlD domain-containing protein [Solirubrobacteraceae bacterium]|nr:AzlD domain-containing protein [Solirubrobacteraceae bacterium]